MRAQAAQRRLIFTVAMGAVFLAAQLSSFSHQLLVKHITCAEHGELIHAGETDAAPVADANSVTSTAQVAGHGHEHCDVFLARREQLAVVPPAVVVLAAAPLALPLPVFTRTVHSVSVPLLRLAPKSSPPA